jgi:hypothetical protein
MQFIGPCPETRSGSISISNLHIDFCLTNQMSPLCCTQYCKERNLKMHHWLVKDTKNQVINIVRSCRYEHQEMGQISGGKRGSLALTVSGYILYCMYTF